MLNDIYIIKRKCLPPIPSWVVKIIDGVLGDKDLSFPCDWEVSDASVDTGDRICCWYWLTLGYVLAATSAAVLGLIKVALANIFGLLWISLDCPASCKCAECNPIGEVNELKNISYINCTDSTRCNS